MNRLLCTLLLASATAVIPAQAGLITLDGPSTVNGAFDVSVKVTGVFDAPHDLDLLLGYGFNLTYDNSILTFLGETPGSLFDDLSGNPGIGAQVAGLASAVFLAPGDFAEPLTLAVLHFKVAGYGATTVSISGDPSASLDQGLAYLSASDAIGARASLTAVPEPGSAWLCGMGILAVGAGLLKRRQPSA